MKTKDIDNAKRTFPELGRAWNAVEGKHDTLTIPLIEDEVEQSERIINRRTSRIVK